MSGFFPGSIASWALGGGAGSGNNNNGDDEQPGDQGGSSNEELTEAEVRARRLARMEALQKQQQEAAANGKTAAAAEEPMDIDEQKPKATSPQKMEIDGDSQDHKKPAAAQSSLSIASAAAGTSPDKDQQKKKRAKESHSPAAANSGTPTSDGNRKFQRKMELMLKKALSIALVGTSTTSDSSCVVIDIDGTDVTVQTIAEILATRLSLSADAPELRTMPAQKALIPYLAHCHRKAAEEIQTMKQSSKKAPADLDAIMEILEEIKRQVVSYAASCLMEPELFELGKDATAQLAKCFLSSVTDLSASITFGVTGTTSSFYYCLCEELVAQDKDTFDRVVADVVTSITKSLTRLESVLEGGEGAEGSGLVLVSALTSLCFHKKAAEVVTNLDNFLLPPAGSREAEQQVLPPAPAVAPGTDPFMAAMMAALRRPKYLKRSGPALERDTILGLCLRLGVPNNNPAFAPTNILRQTLDSVERTNSSQRQQLKVHQEACNQLVVAIIKAGPEARTKLMKWFVDCLLVNFGATATRPDMSKISSSSLRLNALLIMLKLCEPFVNDEKKQHLIDAGFVSSAEDHFGIYATSGDDAVPRLCEADQGSLPPPPQYNPKNSFIPMCFFLTARFIHISIVPLLANHELLLRNISHLHWELTSQNRDITTDADFSMLVSRQRGSEVSLFQDEMIAESLRYSNLMSKVLFEMDDETMRRMPEHFVDDICSLLMPVAKMKSKLLRGFEARYVFKLMVKLLSPKYTGMIRNYNLRAMLGDVLYELYLPAAGDDRRDVPSSVAVDPLAGGQTFLLSDANAQESLAPSLLLLYGEVEHTGHYDKMNHRAKIASLIKYLWESSEHRPAFRRITQNKTSFIKFANGIMNETNTLIATVMQKLPEIREAQLKMKNVQEWGRLSEEEQSIITSRLDDNEREVKHALPLCNKTLQMFGYLNTDRDIRSLFLLEELCSRLVTMLLHVLTKLVGSKGLDLKVDNPDQYDFKPKEMLRDLCAIFALFASSNEFQVECAKSGCDPELLNSAVKTSRRLNLLTGESMTAFESLPAAVEKEKEAVAADDELVQDAPEEFLDELLSTFMKDPIRLPSGHFVDRSTITQHLLNDLIDPFNREPMTVDDIVPATELKERLTTWLADKRAARDAAGSS